MYLDIAQQIAPVLTSLIHPYINHLVLRTYSLYSLLLLKNKKLNNQIMKLLLKYVDVIVLSEDTLLKIVVNISDNLKTDTDEQTYDIVDKNIDIVINNRLEDLVGLAILLMADDFMDQVAELAMDKIQLN